MNSDARNVLSEFLHSENLAFLFLSLYSKVKMIIPDAVIRGIPGQIFGVSRRNERCLFYVTYDPDQSLVIHYKGYPNEIAFLKENAGIIADFVVFAAQRRKQNPQDYQIDEMKISNIPETLDHALRSPVSMQTQGKTPDKAPAKSENKPANDVKQLSGSDKHRLPDVKSVHKIDQTAQHKLIEIKSADKKAFTDKEIRCKDCGKFFVFSAGEQTFYNEKWLNDPVLCKSCRDRKKLFAEAGKYIGLGSITGKMGTKSSSYLEHAQTYGPSINVDGGLPNSPGFRRGKEKNGMVEYTAKVGKKKLIRKRRIDY